MNLYRIKLKWKGELDWTVDVFVVASSEAGAERAFLAWCDGRAADMNTRLPDQPLAFTAQAWAGDYRRVETIGPLPECGVVVEDPA